jgi:sulfite reductase (ferredoxin)
VKETKTQQVERHKQAMNPWESLDAIRDFARTGRKSIPPEWSGVYLKWWGINPQGDGLGAIGGKDGVGNASDYFMLRIGVPGNTLTSRQLEAVGQLCRKYARNVVDISLRHTLQFHWITIENIPEIIDSLNSVGLSTQGTAGDVLVSVTGCPLAGKQHGELLDVSPLISDISTQLSTDPQFYNLPRKFKMTVSSCPIGCTYPELNDLALTAVKRGDEVGYSISVGGGLSREPHFSLRLKAFIHQDQAMPVLRAVLQFISRQDCLRERRDQARTKHLFLQQGWTADRFLSGVESVLGYRLDSELPEIDLPAFQSDHLGIHAQKQQGLDYVGVSVLCGRLTSEQMIAIARLSDEFGSGEICLSAGQNLIIPNVPQAVSGSLGRKVLDIGLTTGRSSFEKGAISCTGTEFCKFGVAETKNFTRTLVSELEQRIPEFDKPIRLHVAGCSNGCGKHRIADIGLEGGKQKVGESVVDAYNIFVGGAIGRNAAFSRRLGYRCPATELPAALEKLLRGYMKDRDKNESLRSFLVRKPDEYLLALLEGAPESESSASVCTQK